MKGLLTPLDRSLMAAARLTMQAGELRWETDSDTARNDMMAFITELGGEAFTGRRAPAAGRRGCLCCWRRWY